MGYWKKHPRKELDAVLDAFHDAGWAVLDPPRYYKVRCPCGKHQRSIHLTPSDPNYMRNALKWLARQQCSNGGGTA